MKRSKIIYLLLIILYVSCSQTDSNKEKDTTQNIEPTLITPVLDAHGGQANWQKLRTFEFDLPANEEQNQVDLWTRKSLITTSKFKIGSDGNKVWMLQDTVAFKNDPRFYHNLMFYFVAMPFVLSDPGITYETVPDLEVDSQAYSGVKISYESNVGDAAKDNYILYFDKETKEMAYLAYTVTYFSDEVSDKYSLIKYTFGDVDGLKLPTQMQWLKYENGQVGEPRGEPRVVENIKISETPLDSTIFSIPEGATLH